MFAIQMVGYSYRNLIRCRKVLGVLHIFNYLGDKYSLDNKERGINLH